MKKAYGYLFWGILLTSFHINLGPIEILPDFIGYLIISEGIAVMKSEYNAPDQCKNYKTATYLSQFLTIYAFLRFITLLLSDISSHWILNILGLFLSWTGELLMLYLIFCVSISWLISNNWTDLASQYNKNLHYYIIIDSTLLITTLVGFAFYSSGILAITILVNLFFKIWLLSTIHSLKERSTPPSDSTFQPNEEI